MVGMTLTVTQVSNYVKSIFDAEEMLIGVKVVGEITNLKPSSRAIYFDVKDENASLSCVCFDQFLVSSFKFGDKVIVTGKFNYYAKTGKLSFIVSKLEKYGVGELYKQYLELKDKLEKEGLFNSSVKKKLPPYVNKVGVVSSETGAVIKDIIRVAREKNNFSNIVLYPVKVQGVGAENEIVKGIEFLDKYGCDCIIVARGGGSFEDYQPFNTEVVARAVFNAKTPIVSAIGHENDWSLIDYVADVRAGTPSIASDLVFFSENLLINNLNTKLSVPLAKFTLKNSECLKHLNEQYKTVINLIKQKINLSLSYVNVAKNSLETILEKKLIAIENALEIKRVALSKSNPAELLNRGYARAFVNNKALNSIAQVNVDSVLQTTLKDGVIYSVVNKIEEK